MIYFVDHGSIYCRGSHRFTWVEFWSHFSSVSTVVSLSVSMWDRPCSGGRVERVNRIC